MPRPNGPHGGPGMPRPDVLTGDVMPMGCLGCTIPAALGVLGMIGAAAALIGTFL